MTDMAEKAIRLGGESTADAIVSAVDSLYPEHTFEDKEFALKHNDDEIAVDTNFAAQSFWKDAILRFFGKRSAVLGLILIVVIVLLAVFGPGMNSYTYSGQDLSQKNFAPRVPGIERLGTDTTRLVRNFSCRKATGASYRFTMELTPANRTQM